MKTDEELIAAGFTNSGTARYRNTANGFCDELFTKAVAFGDRDKAEDVPREVTHEHVRDAAAQIAERGRKGQSALQICCQIGEYLCTGVAGVGAAKFDQNLGIILFVASMALGVVLFVVRNTQKK